MSNPIVNLDEEFIVWGKKTLQRQQVDLKPFLEDLAVLMEENRLDETPKLYEQYPSVRIGIRRAMFAVEKMKQNES